MSHPGTTPFVPPAPNTDNSGNQVHNGGLTYLLVADQLLRNGGCIIGWGDGAGSHYDILFTYKPAQYCGLQTVPHGPSSLFVSIMRVGAFGFDISFDKSPLHPSYISEKLNCHGMEDKVTELINGVIRSIRGTRRDNPHVP